MILNLKLIGVKFFWVKDYHLYYGYDPDTNGKSLYLWNNKKHRKACKLLKII